MDENLIREASEIARMDQLEAAERDELARHRAARAAENEASCRAHRRRRRRAWVGSLLALAGSGASLASGILLILWVLLGANLESGLMIVGGLCAAFLATAFFLFAARMGVFE